MTDGNWIGQKKLIRKKKPLLGYEEWTAIDTGLWKEVRARNATGGPRERRRYVEMGELGTDEYAGTMEMADGISLLSPARAGACHL